MKTFEVLIIGGGVAGMSCALVLGSAKSKPFAKDKKIGIIIHQKSSALTNGLFNNVLGIKAGTTGKELLETGKEQLLNTYPDVSQIENEKVISITKEEKLLLIITNKNKYLAKNVVVAVGPSNMFSIDGLMKYVIPHQNLPARKERIQLKNSNYLVTDNLYVAGVLAGLRSQFAIAAGSGTQVATDILTKWNDGNTTMVHDSVKKG